MYELHILLYRTEQTVMTYQVAILVFGKPSNIRYILFIAHLQPKFDRTYSRLC